MNEHKISYSDKPYNVTVYEKNLDDGLQKIRAIIPVVSEIDGEIYNLRINTKGKYIYKITGKYDIGYDIPFTVTLNANNYYEALTDFMQYASIDDTQLREITSIKAIPNY